MTQALKNTERASTAGAGLSESGFARFADVVYRWSGIHLPPEKRLMVETRIRKRIEACELGSFEEYWRLVSDDDAGAGERIHLIDVITTNKTDFFRESDHFRQLTERALPSLAGAGRERPLAVWSAGCSTGEEPYTLAMAIAEYASGVAGSYDFSILATDISTRVLDKARAAIYPLAAFEPLPAAWRSKYILRSRDASRGVGRVGPAARQPVTFRRLNLMDEGDRMNDIMDVVFCRNVVIYFDRAGQERVMRRLVRQLRLGGYLFTGHSETLNAMDIPVKVVGPTMYRKVL